MYCLFKPCYCMLIKTSSFLPTLVTTADFIQLKMTTSEIYAISKKTREFVSIEPLSNIESKAIYMLVGVGALISVFLFIIIIILLYKKSNQSEGRIGGAIGRPQNDSPLHGVSTNQGNWRPYNTIADHLKDHSYRSLEDGYAEINENVERNVSNNSTPLVGSGIQETVSESSIESDDNFQTMNEVYDEEVTGDMRNDFANLYLQPISGLRIKRTSQLD